MEVSLVMRRLQVIHAVMHSTQEIVLGQNIDFVNLVSVPGENEDIHLRFRHFIFPNIGRKGADLV